MLSMRRIILSVSAMQIVLIWKVNCYVEPTKCFKPSAYPFITERESKLFIKVHRGRRTVSCSNHGAGATVDCINDERSCECNMATCSKESDREIVCRLHGRTCTAGQFCYLRTPCPAHWKTECGDRSCLSNPCKNDATCADDGILSYNCTCRSGYQGTNCDIDTNADVVFLVDTSLSQNEATLHKQKQYLQKFISNLTTGSRDFQFALVTYSLHASVQFYLNASSTKAEMTSAIDAIQSENGPSFTGKGLRTIREEILTAQNGARQDARKHVIVLSDGLSSDSTDTLLQASLLKQTGVDVIAVATGDHINHRELSDIATHWNKVFSVINNYALNSILKSSIGGIDCKHQTSDLAIMFDHSSDISVANYFEQVSAIADLLKVIPVGADSVHVGLYQFSQTVDNVFKLDDYFSSHNMVVKLNGIQQLSEAGNATKGLNFLQQHAFLATNGARANVRQVVLLVTSGKFEDENLDDLVQEATNLKNMGVILATVSAGANANMTTLVRIASDPAFVYVIGKDLEIDYDVLYTLTGSLEFDACELE